MKNGIFRILALGDVVGSGGVRALEERLRRFRGEHGIDLAIVNGENSAPRNGIDPESAQCILAAGADAITTGNHVWRQKQMHDWLDSGNPITRPANYPPSAPGSGSVIVEAEGYRILVINVLGVIYLDPLENPFVCVDRVLARNEGRYDFAVLDIHAEATSEKIALGRYFDGRIAAIYGTHTHVQTADAQLLPRGSGYITDLGMTGPADSCLGVKNEIIIDRLKNGGAARFEQADGRKMLNGCIFEIDRASGKTVDTERIYIEERN